MKNIFTKIKIAAIACLIIAIAFLITALFSTNALLTTFSYVIFGVFGVAFIVSLICGFVLPTFTKIDKDKK